MRETNRMKIMAIHGLWGRPSFWEEFKEYFKEGIFLTPNVNWSKIDYKNLSKQLISFNPDILIGHSHGGYVVQRLLEKNPHSAKKCILISSVGPKGVSLSSLYRIIKKFPKKFIEGILTNRIDIDDYNLAEKFMLTGLSREISERYYSQFMSEKTWDILKVISLFCKNIKKSTQIPTLVVSGDLDMIVTNKEAQSIADFHRADYIHFSNYGHMLITKHIAQEIEQWINKATVI